MKKEFALDSHKAEFSGSTISIIGREPEHSVYVRIQLPNNQYLFIEGRDLQLFSKNLQKALTTQTPKP